MDNSTNRIHDYIRPIKDAKGQDLDGFLANHMYHNLEIET